MEGASGVLNLQRGFPDDTRGTGRRTVVSGYRREILLSHETAVRVYVVRHGGGDVGRVWNRLWSE